MLGLASMTIFVVVLLEVLCHKAVFVHHNLILLEHSVVDIVHFIVAMVGKRAHMGYIFLSGLLSMEISC